MEREGLVQRIVPLLVSNVALANIKKRNLFIVKHRRLLSKQLAEVGLLGLHWLLDSEGSLHQSVSSYTQDFYKDN